jgi:LysR family transcriptional regulator, positive regulator for ilvC
LDYQALRLFLHLSRTLHFGRTSRECHISASALSRAVQRLEGEVGWPLLERDHRRVALTPQGAQFAEHARETLERWHALGQRLRGKTAALAGSISVFASVTACQSFLPRVLSSFRQRYPEIHIRLETGYAADALELVQQGAVDVAVAALPDRTSPALVTRVLLHTPLVFVAPASACEVSRLLERQPLPWAEVPIVLPATGLARASADRWFRRRRLRPLVYGEVPGSEALLSLVALGCGIGIVPRLVVDKSPLRAEVRALEVDPGLGEFRVGLCTHKRKLISPLVRAFWNATQGRGRPV